jgi:hypothetical protein
MESAIHWHVASDGWLRQVSSEVCFMNVHRDEFEGNSIDVQFLLSKVVHRGGAGVNA